MISSNWETPSNQNNTEKKVVIFEQTSSENSLTSSFSKVIDELQKALDHKIKSHKHVVNPNQLSLFTEIETGGLVSNKVVYDPNGPVPFPKTFDIDDKLHENQHQKIQNILDKYGIVCPGAESVTIEKDHLDPLTTIITIRKTIF